MAVMRDWLARIKEDSKEYRNSRYREKLVHPRAEIAYQGRGPLRPEIQTFLQKAQCGSLDGRKVTVVPSCFNMLEIHPLKLAGNPPCGVPGKTLHREISHWRPFATKLPEGYARGSRWLLGAAGHCALQKSSVGENNASWRSLHSRHPRTRKQKLFPPAMYLQCPLMAKYQLARGNI